MKCDHVGKSEKTAIVITTLLCNAGDVKDSIRKLKKYCVNNRNDDDELFFGLICDLPQSNQKHQENDQNIIEALKNEIDHLNQDMNCFFAVIRERVFHESENAYVGWERKRGAIEQFVDFARNGVSPDDFTFFGNCGVVGSKYLITLDSDTELGIGQAKRLIGKMLHPLNTPRQHCPAPAAKFFCPVFPWLFPSPSV